MTDTQPFDATSLREWERKATEDARRREWAAALRWAAGSRKLDELTRAAHHATADQIEACRLTPWADQPEPPTPPDDRIATRVERGDFTPWVNQPEPAAPPAQHPHTAPAAAGPHPGTPQRCGARFVGHEDGEITCDLPAGHGGFHEETETGFDWGPPHPDTPDGAAGVSGVLGRATVARGLLDRRQRVWLSAGEPAGAYWTLGAAQGWWTAEAIEEDAGGPVREVLLVYPAAGWVIETAVAARLAERNADDPGGWGRWQDAIEAHHAAVDVLDGDRPAEPGPALSDWLAAIDNALRNGSYMTGANLAFELLCDWLRVDRCVLNFDPMWSQRRDPSSTATEPAPEPDSGPRWHREGIADASGRLPADLAAQVDGLLGDWAHQAAVSRERGRELKRVTSDLSRTEDELAEVTTDRNRAVEALGDAVTKGGRLASEVERLRAALATARRDAAADALDWAAGNLLVSGAQSLLESWADEIRADDRPVPGSPQPAGQAPRCPCGCNPNGEPTAHVTLPFPCLCGVEHGTYADAHRAHEGELAGSPQPAEGGGDDAE